MPGSGILVDIVLDAFGFKRRLQACGRRSRYAVGAAVAGDDRTTAAQRLSGGYGIRACRIVGAEAWKPRVAASSAKPPPCRSRRPLRGLCSRRARPASAGRRRCLRTSCRVCASASGCIAGPRPPFTGREPRLRSQRPRSDPYAGARRRPDPRARPPRSATARCRPAARPGPSAPRGTIAIADTWPRAGYFMLVGSRGASRPPGCRSTLRCWSHRRAPTGRSRAARRTREPRLR
jgi:hypothetical protein